MSSLWNHHFVNDYVHLHVCWHSARPYTYVQRQNEANTVKHRLKPWISIESLQSNDDYLTINGM